MPEVTGDTGRPGAIVVVHRIPAAVTPLGTWLAEIADRVVLVTARACVEGYQGTVGEVIGVDDYADTAELDQALETIVARRPIAALVCGTEDDLLRVAAARERHGLPGPGTAAARVVTDKLLMKQAVAGAVPLPDYTADRGAVDDLVERVGFPLVVKPRRSWGSRGVHVVRTRAELQQALAGRPADDLLVEQFVTGELCHVDGFAVDGQVVSAVPSRYLNDCLTFQDQTGTPLGSVQLDPDDPAHQVLREATVAVVGALPPGPLAPFHLELFLDRAAGAVVFCEIAGRLGGGHVMETLADRLGRNPVEIWYRAQAGLLDPPPPHLRPGAAGFLLVPPRVGTLVGVCTDDVPEWVAGFALHVQPPATFDGAGASTDSLFDFVVLGSDAAEVTGRLEECSRLAATMTRWAA